MNSKITVIILSFLLFSACSKKPLNQSSDDSMQNSNPSSLNPESLPNYSQRQQPKQKTWFFGLFKKKQKLSMGDQLIVEYEERMKRNAKEARKKARKMKKPQYSDPTYFGHKRKPKKRAPEKMKYCEECGIRH